MSIKQLFSCLLLFEIQFQASTMSGAKVLLQKGLECYYCGGPNNMCSGEIIKIGLCEKNIYDIVKM